MKKILVGLALSTGLAGAEDSTVYVYASKDYDSENLRSFETETDCVAAKEAYRSAECCTKTTLEEKKATVVPMQGKPVDISNTVCADSPAPGGPLPYEHTVPQPTSWRWMMHYTIDQGDARKGFQNPIVDVSRWGFAANGELLYEMDRHHLDPLRTKSCDVVAQSKKQVLDEETGEVIEDDEVSRCKQLLLDEPNISPPRLPLLETYLEARKLAEEYDDERFGRTPEDVAKNKVARENTRYANVYKKTAWQNVFPGVDIAVMVPGAVESDYDLYFKASENAFNLGVFIAPFAGVMLHENGKGLLCKKTMVGDCYHLDSIKGFGLDISKTDKSFGIGLALEINPNALLLEVNIPVTPNISQTDPVTGIVTQVKNPFSYLDDFNKYFNNSRGTPISMYKVLKLFVDDFANSKTSQGLVQWIGNGSKRIVDMPLDDTLNGGLVGNGPGAGETTVSRPYLPAFIENDLGFHIGATPFRTSETDVFVELSTPCPPNNDKRCKRQFAWCTNQLHAVVDGRDRCKVRQSGEFERHEYANIGDNEMPWSDYPKKSSIIAKARSMMIPDYYNPTLDAVQTFTPLGTLLDGVSPVLSGLKQPPHKNTNPLKEMYKRYKSLL